MRARAVSFALGLGLGCGLGLWKVRGETLAAQELLLDQVRTPRGPCPPPQPPYPARLPPDFPHPNTRGAISAGPPVLSARLPRTQRGACSGAAGGVMRDGGDSP